MTYKCEPRNGLQRMVYTGSRLRSATGKLDGLNQDEKWSCKILEKLAIGSIPG